MYNIIESISAHIKDFRSAFLLEVISHPNKIVVISRFHVQNTMNNTTFLHYPLKSPLPPHYHSGFVNCDIIVDITH